MFEELKELICEYVDVEPLAICGKSCFTEGLGFNFYDSMSMVGEIENRLDVGVEEREAVSVKTVGDVAEYIRSLQD